MLRWLIALVASARVAGAAPIDERIERGLPDVILETAPLGDGEALVLGGMVTPGTGWPFVQSRTQRVVILDGRGAVTGELIPRVGEALDLAALDGTAWVLGRDAVAVKPAGASWVQIALEPRAGGGHLVALDPTHAIVLRTGTAEMIDAATGKIDPLLNLPGKVFWPAVADGTGGMWAMVMTSDDSAIGYARYARGAWTLWPLSAPRDDLARAGFQIAAVATTGAFSHDELVSDGHGGWFGRNVDALVHAGEDGTARVMPGVIPAGARAIAWDPTRERLLVLVLPDQPRREPARLVELDRDGKQLASEDLPTPPWFRERRNLPPPTAAWVSAGATTWVSFGALVLQRRDRRWRVAYSPTLPDRAQLLDDTERRQAREHARGSIASGVAVASTSIVAGTLGASAIHGDRRAGLELIGGSMGAFGPVLLINGTLPSTWNHGNSGGPGMPRTASSVVNGLQRVGFVMGITGAIAFGGLGAWAAGELADPATSRRDAVLGAFAGSAVATAGSVAVMSWLARRWPERFWLRATAGSLLIGAGASLGYQLGGGGAR